LFFLYFFNQRTKLMTTNYELRPGQGSAFKNKNKTEDWHPAYKGEVMLPDGTLHWIDIKPGKTKAGEHWFAIKIGAPKQPKQNGQQQGMVLDVRYGAPSDANGQPYPRPQAQPTAQPIAKPSPAANAVSSMDDDIPF
jgi:hypothetical protein